MSKLLLKGGTLFINGVFIKQDVSIVGNRIESIKECLSEYDQIVDCSGLLITLGFVDMHVHLREPGFTYKETISSGSLAALHGGYTHLVAMANTLPCMDSLETVELFKQIVARDAKINVFTYSALTKGLKGETIVDIESLSHDPIILGFSDDGRGVQEGSKMLEAMRLIKKYQSMIVAHCEDESLLIPGGCVHLGKVSQRLNVQGISSESEYMQVQRDIEFIRNTHTKYHVCHVSTKETVNLIREAKKEGLPVTCEVTPHHLLLCEDDVVDDGNYKMNPPLRSIEDQLALIEGLKDGTIDVIATDHAPHSIKEKSKGIVQSPFGIIGNEFAFSLLYTHLVKKGIITLEMLLNKMSYYPSEILGLKHAFNEQEIANLAIIDLNQSYLIDASKLHSLSQNTPFINQMVEGRVVKMIVNGRYIDLEKQEGGI